MFDTRGVSRERIIGISFVDILIQAVFLLLLILMVGYIDPEEQLFLEPIDPEKKEYAGIGLDLCNKLFKDSPKTCRDYTEKTNLGPVPKPGFENIGSEVCKKLGKNSIEDCSAALDKVYGLWPCIDSKKSKVKAPWAVSWRINSLTTAIFLGFSPEYLEYVNSQKNTVRLGLVKDATQYIGTQMGASEIESKFGFIRESQCFHEVTESRSVPAADEQVAQIRNAIYGLRKLSPN